MRLLINTPFLKLPGGVSNHFKGLLKFWNIPVRYNCIGGRFGLPGVLVLPLDYTVFYLRCLFGGYTHVLLNPSLGKTALVRDALFLKIAKLTGKTVVIFIHGWDLEMQKVFDENPDSFLNKYASADGFFVLANKFKIVLQQWGVTAPIWLTTTKVDDALLKNFTLKNSSERKELNLLFLARVETNKGIYLALDAFKLIKSKISFAELEVVGNGSELTAAKEYCLNNNITSVNFVGQLTGKPLINAFSNADIYVLPTSHGEGMPTSVLEAMAFGLPVVSRPVGGLVDFFENDKMGYLVESLKPQDFAEAILSIVQKQNKYNEISHYNHTYAKQHFMASKVVKQLEGMIANV
ncbi:MAG: hypothetical protein Wins2KO_28540 [Winogradskyella sp.]